MTPLHWAVEYVQYEIIDYILTNHLDQIDFNSVDKFNRTVYELALITRNNKIIQLIEDKNRFNTNNLLFNKTQFNIKSFAKPIKGLPQPINKKIVDEQLSPNSKQMNETLNWLENQIYTEKTSIDLLEEIKNGRELVLTGLFSS